MGRRAKRAKHDNLQRVMLQDRSTAKPPADLPVALADANPGPRERVARLFPEDPPRPGLSRWGWLAALAVIAGAVVGLGRVPGGPGVLNTIWAEDGSNFLTDALTRNEFRMILRPLNGYFVMVPRALAIPAGWAPIEWGPAILTIEAALVTGLMALGVHFASRQYLHHSPARLIAAAPIVAVPIAENVAAAASNNVATLQFAGVYTAMWMVLWVPQRKAARIASVLAVLAVGVSSFLAVILIPLALLRLYGRRDLISAGMVGSLSLALAANLTALAAGRTARPTIMPSNWDPLWALQTTAEWALPHSLFGYGITGRGDQNVHPSWLIQASWVVVGLVVLLAALRVTRPHWKLAALMGLTAVAFACGTLMQYGAHELRYVIAPELMLFAALAALLLPRPDRPRWLALAPLITLFAGVALVFAFSYQTVGPRARELAPWDESVARARLGCQEQPVEVVAIDPTDATAPVFLKEESTGQLRGFPVLIPCGRLR